MKEIWANKYRPNSLSEFVFQNNNHKDKFSEYLETKNIPNLLLSGNCGVGKSTIARLLINNIIDKSNIDFDVKVINASKDNGVDYVRNNISSFIESYPMGEIKIVLLEEADYLSQSAQAILRSLTEDYSDSVRFIITCNYPNKLIPPLKSRFTQYHFNDMPIEDMILRVGEILVDEKVEINLPIIEKCVNTCYPDLRQVLVSIQDCVVNGQLVDKPISNSEEWSNSCLDYLLLKQWDNIQHMVETIIPDTDFEKFYEMLYCNVASIAEKHSALYDMYIVTIAEHLHRHSTYAIPYINAVACILKLKSIK